MVEARAGSVGDREVPPAPRIFPASELGRQLELMIYSRCITTSFYVNLCVIGVLGVCSAPALAAVVHSPTGRRVNGGVGLGLQ